MARAKKTDRAEARRRARLAAAESATTASIETGAPAAGGASGRGGSASASAGGTPSGRPGIGNVLRGSIRSIDLRQDIRDIPWLVTKTNAVWLPSLLIVGSAILFALGGSQMAGIPGLAFNLFVFPPPLASAFLAGILTERMSYLAGFLVGLLSAIVFAAYVLVVQIPGNELTLAERGGYVLYGLAVSPLAGLAIGGFAGFYRRFLRSANPNPRRGQQPPRSKPPTKAAARR